MSASISLADHTTVLPASLFGKKHEVACTLFVQDAKIDFNRLRNGQSGAMYTCEFGLGAASQWGVHWGKEESRPLNRAVKLLNSRNIRIWFMTRPDCIEMNVKKDGDSNFLAKFQNALKGDSRNLLQMENPFGQKFPTPYNRAGFNSKQLSTYYALGVTPYSDPPAEELANISGEYPKNPRIAVMDGGGTGPVNRIMGYKFLTRLAMNGTDAAIQNPPYVMIESVYRSDLAPMLKARFPNETKLVLKHVAATRGQGVVTLDVATLDDDLKKLLAPESDFKKVSPLSICLVEKFIPGEAVFRVVYLALQDRGKFELHVIDADKTTSQSDIINEGNTVLLNDADLELIQNRAAKEISSIAKRALQFDAQAALKYFLNSDNPILNLVGVELLNPTFVCSYRIRIGEGQKRLSSEQCDWLLTLVKRNPNPLLVRRMFENCFHDAWQIFVGQGTCYVPKFLPLLKAMWETGNKEDMEPELKKFAAELTSCTNGFDIDVLISTMKTFEAKE